MLLHLQHARIPRPSKLVGITSLKSHHERSAERIHDSQARSGVIQNTEVDLYLGDAVYRDVEPGSLAHNTSHCHPLGPNGGEFNSILALDCAYHFNTRQLFLRQCFTHLSRGGKIALADICFKDVRPPSPFLRNLLAITGMMPPSNVVIQQEYMCIMTELGYEDVTIEDITSHVFPGFMRFLKQRGLMWRLFVFIFNTVLVKNGATFVIITGRKPSAPANILSPRRNPPYENKLY